MAHHIDQSANFLQFPAGPRFLPGAGYALVC